MKPQPLTPESEAALRELRSMALANGAEVSATDALLATLDASRERTRELEEVLSNLVERIRGEPTMSGHLVGVQLRPDHGDSHATSDAVRAARAALAGVPR